MSKIDIARAMKDDAYRASLSAEQLAQLPENAAGVVALSDEDLRACSGGMMNPTLRSVPWGDRGPCDF